MADAATAVVVLDTSVLTLLSRPKRIAHWPASSTERLATSTLAASPVTLAEVEYGLRREPNLPDSYVRRERALLAGLAVLPIDPVVVGEWARLKCDATPGLQIGDNDLWIAATAAAHGVPVFTSDTGFAAVKDLVEVIYLPSAPTSQPQL